MNKDQSRLLAIAAVMSVLWISWSTYTKVVALQYGQDFATYWSAYQSVELGLSPYNGATLSTVFHNLTGLTKPSDPFLYPPPFLLCLTWLKPFTVYGQARDAWFAFNIGLTLILGWRLAHWSKLPLVWCVLGVELFAPTYRNLVTGQVNIALTIILLEAVGHLNGIWLASGVMLKVSPVLGLLVLVARSQWRQLLLFLGTVITVSLVSLLIMPPSIYIAFEQRVFGGLVAGEYSALMLRLDLGDNSSIARLLCLLGPDTRVLTPFANAIRLNCIALGVALVAHQSRHEVIGSVHWLRITGALGCLIILAAPIAWTTHLELTLPAIAFIWTTMSAKPREQKSLFACLHALLALPEDWWIPIGLNWPIAMPFLACNRLIVVVMLFILCLKPPPNPNSPLSRG